jgi:hypothetical protein
VSAAAAGLPSWQQGFQHCGGLAGWWAGMA